MEPGRERTEGESVDDFAVVVVVVVVKSSIAAAVPVPVAATTEPLTAAVPEDAEEDKEDDEDEGEGAVVPFLFLLAFVGAVPSFVALASAKHVSCCCCRLVVGVDARSGALLLLPLGPQASPLDARRASMAGGKREGEGRKRQTLRVFLQRERERERGFEALSDSRPRA